MSLDYHNKSVTHLAPTVRLRATAVVWWILAAIPLLVAVTVKWFSVEVAIAIAIRTALGVYAWRQAQSLRVDPSARRGVAPVVLLLAPIALFVGGIAFERMDVPVHQPSLCTPEWVLPLRGNLEGRAWFGDRDNPSMVMCLAMLVALILGISVATARRRPS